MADVILPLKGRMNYDDDISQLQGGDYPIAFNVESQNMGEGFALTPTLGNKKAFDLGEQALQNQKVRVTIPQNLSNTVSAMTVALFNGNGQLIGLPSVANIIFNNVFIKQQIKTELDSISPYPITYSNLNNTDSFEIEISANYSDWKLEIGVDDSVIPFLPVVVIQEAVNATGVGQFIPIGSVRAGDDLLIFSTTQRELPKRVGNILSITQDLQGRVIITTLLPHGLSELTSVNIGGISGATGITGTWTIFVLSPTSFGLHNSIFNGQPTGGSVFANVYGYGCIGLMSYNEQTDSYRYTKLLRSKKLNFVTKKQIDADAEVSNDRISVYYTDNYNAPRNFYYKGQVTEDGAVNALNSANIYNYETLSIQAQNIIDYSNYDVEVVQPQIQTGGDTPSGTFRYSVQFLTENFTATENSRLTNPIFNYEQLYDPDNQNLKVFGSTGKTGKINRVRVSGFPANTFKYIELVCHQYAGIATEQAINSFIVRREVLEEGQTEITLEHNGSEPNTLEYNTGQATLLGTFIKTAKTNRIIKNRLVYGNVTTHAETNLQEWVDTFNYRIIRRETNVAGSGVNIKTHGEFYDPENVTNNVGHMPYEWHRYYVTAKFKNNQPSKSFFLADVRFVPSVEYSDPASPFYFEEFKETNKRNKRDLTNDEYLVNDFGQADTISGIIYQYGMEVLNIDWSYLIDGVAASDLIDEIYIEKKPLVKEVLGSGHLMLSEFIGTTALVARRICTMYSVIKFGGLQDINNPFLDDFEVNSFTNFRLFNLNKTAFYCPDWYFTGQYPEYRQGDKLIVLGKPQSEPSFGIMSGIYTLGLLSTYIYFFTQRRPQFREINLARIYDIKQAVNLTSGEPYTFDDGDEFTKAEKIDVLNASGTTTANGITAYPGLVCHIDGTPFSDYINGNVNNAKSNERTLYSLYFRARKEKYGNINSGETEYTGAKAKSGEQSVQVFGGDTFFQQTSFKFYRRSNANQAQGMTFFSHNRVNVNLRLVDLAIGGVPYGLNSDTVEDWLGETPTSFDQTKINSSYTLINRIQSNPVFDPNLIETPAMLGRMPYSEFKPQGSIKDNYREFLPFNFRDKDLTDGAITKLINLNGRLVVYQERNFSVEYFDSSGRLKVADGGDVIFGDGSVLSRDGDDLTQYGTKHQFAIIEGVSVGGKKVLYAIGTDYSTITRFGADGTVDLGLRNKMRTFLMNNTRFAKKALTPADGYGITGVWDSRKLQAYFTCRAWDTNVKPWGSTEGKIIFIPNVGSAYPAGAVKSYLTEQGIPIFYITKKLTPLTINPLTDVENGGEYWARIPMTNGLYYNVWTLVYSEKESGFKLFNGFYPKIYMNLDTHYFSANPDIDKEIYRHDDNEPLLFYGNEQEGYIQHVMNIEPRIPKKMVALAIQSEEKPFKVECETEHISYLGKSVRIAVMNENDFTIQQNVNYAPILNNFVNGSSLGKTEQLRGLYLKVKTFFKPLQKQIIRDITAKIRVQFKNVKS